MVTQILCSLSVYSVSSVVKIPARLKEELRQDAVYDGTMHVG